MIKSFKVILMDYSVNTVRAIKVNIIDGNLIFINAQDEILCGYAKYQWKEFFTIK